MNKIKTTDIVDPSIQQPFTGNSLDFLQNGNKAMIDALSKGIIDDYSASVGYIVFGCVDNGTTVTAGAIYYNGELYSVDAISYTLSFGTVLLVTASNTNDATADPLQFSDLVLRNVHNVRKLAISGGATGTGLFDLSAAVRLYKPANVVVSLTAINNNWTSTVLVFDVDVNDPEGIHNTSTGRFTPKKAGWYRLSTAVLSIYTTPVAVTGGIYIKKNGSTFLQPFYRDVLTSTVRDTYTMNELIYANGTTDYFEIAFVGSASNFVTVNGTASLTWERA